MKFKQLLSLVSGALVVLSGLFFAYAVLANRTGKLPAPPRVLAVWATAAFLLGLILAGVSWMIAGLTKPGEHRMSKDINASSPNLERLRHLIDRLLEPEIYMQIVERLPDALIVINSIKEIVIFNEQSSFLFGYHPSEAIGRQLSMLIPADRRSTHDDHITRWFSEMRARSMGIGLKLEGQDKAGRVFPVEINLSPLIAPSGTYGMAVIRRPAVRAEAKVEIESDAGPE